MRRTSERRVLLLGFGFILACLFSTARGMAAIYYVDVNYDGVNGAPDGTMTRPYTSITAAAAVAASNSADTFLVADGIYRSINNGGAENFGSEGIAFGILSCTKTIKGGYVGQVAPGSAGMDWSESSRVLRSSVIDLAAANSRAFRRAVGRTGYFEANGSLVVDGFEFRNSDVSAAGYNGGVLGDTAGEGFQHSGWLISNCLFTNNATAGNGGAIYAYAQWNFSMVISNCVFVNNRSSAGSGGAVYIYCDNFGSSSYRFALENCAFVTNTAAGNGGAVMAVAYDVTPVWFWDCSFLDNVAETNGGAVWTCNRSNAGGYLKFRRCAFRRNQAREGSAVYSYPWGRNMTLDFENCLLVHNRATLANGYTVNKSSVNDTGNDYGIEMVHCTVCDNTGGGLYSKWYYSSSWGRGGAIRLANSVVISNGAYGVYYDSTACEGSNGVPSLVHTNIIYGHTAADCGGTGPTPIVPVALMTDNPLFKDPAAGNYRWEKGSPCVDAGAALGLDTDLEGVRRPLRAGYDLGCYEEWQLPYITNRMPLVTGTSAVLRAEFAYENTGIVTYAWLVLDTADKGTNMASWGSVSNTGPQQQAVVFSAMFTGLTENTVYWFRCVASNDYDVWWGPASSFRTPTGGGVTRLWTGEGGNVLASTPANWAGGELPAENDHILLDTSSSNMTWDGGVGGLPVRVGSWTQTEGYTGTVTIATVYPAAGSFTNFEVMNDMTIAGGTVTHPSNGASAVYRMSMTVRGNFTVGSGGSVNVVGKGYQGGSGPGASTSGGNSGGTHGGMGGYCYGGTPSANVYGSVTAPETLGSGGAASLNDRGGGAVRIQVGNCSLINGVISANGGAVSSSYGPGAGGSVWLTTGTLEGTGLIQADGGTGYDARTGAGGGRIAVKLTSGTNFGSVRMQAFGSRGVTHFLAAAAAGTVYRETSLHGEGHGELIIDNNGGVCDGRVLTLMPPDFNAGDFSSIVIRNKGNLGITTNGAVLDFGSAILNGAGSSNATVTVYSPGAAVSFPVPFSISGYALALDVPCVYTGDWRVAAGGGMTHSANRTSEATRLELTVLGNLTVDAGGEINADGKGYMAGYGPGVPSGYGGAAHGGIGTPIYGGLWMTNTYGSILSPTNLGSGAQNAGGGAIRLFVTGTTTVNGVISARGEGLVSTYGPGSGGSIFINTGVLNGNGLLTADGGQGTSDSRAGAGGGRIAVVVTSATDFGSVTMRARGSVGTVGGPGSAGTICLRTAGQSETEGMVLVDNGSSATNQSYTSLPSKLNPCENLARTVWVTTNTTRLGLATNTTIMGMVLNANGTLELAGWTLVVRDFTVTNRLYRRGVYGPHDTPISALTDSGTEGRVIVLGRQGTVFGAR